MAVLLLRSKQSKVTCAGPMPAIRLLLKGKVKDEQRKTKL